MDILPLTPDLFPAWDEFCLQSAEAWFWHTADWIGYTLEYRPDLHPRSYSFLCREGGKVLAAVPLLLEEHEAMGKKWREFSFGGSALPAPALDAALGPARRARLADSVFEVIDGLASELGVARARFSVSPLIPAHLHPRHAPANELIQRGYLDCTVNTQLIDLRMPEQELLDGMRRNHQRNIEKARDSLRVRIHSGSALTPEKFEEYRLMHARAAGRATRPLSTFHKMRDWLRRGDGLMAEAVLSDGKTVGFELYAIYKEAAYGLSACNEPGHERMPIRHLVEWEAMRWMRERGVKFYEIGALHFGVLPYDFPDKKVHDISLFKYGYGGITVPSFCAERFYSRAYWELTQRDRAERFATAYPFSAESGEAVPGSMAHDLLRRMERSTAQEQDGAQSVPADIRAAAEEIIRANPDAAQSHAQGNPKAAHFLVGRILAANKFDPRIVRQAVEESLVKFASTRKREEK